MNDLLAKGKVKVVFRKRGNNLLRVLLCTLNESFIPPEEMSTYEGALTSSGGDRYIVWDLEKNDWRSFYMDSVLSFEEFE